MLFTRAHHDLVYGEPDLLFTFLDRGDEHLSHRVFKLNGDDSLEVHHIPHELLRYLHLDVLLCVMGHRFLGLYVQLVDLELLLVDDRLSIVLAIKLVILKVRHEVAQCD